MNKYTGRALILVILSLAVVILAIVIFLSAAKDMTVPAEPGEGEEALAQPLAAAVAGISLLFLALGDAIISSVLIYAFAYFAHENANAAMLEVSGRALILPRILKIVSMSEMVISAVLAASGLLALLILFIQ